MKNTAIIHLAGFGVFSATFLSPTTDMGNQRKAPVNHTGIETARQAMMHIPQILTAADKELTHFFSFIQNVNAGNTYSLYLTNKMTQIAEPSISDTVPVSSPRVMQIRKANHQTSTANIEEEDPTETSTAVLIYHSKTDTATSFSNEKEHSFLTGPSEPSPPAFYIDEAVPKEITRSSSTPIISTSQEAGIDSYPEELLQRRITKLKEISAANGCSGKYALMINLGLRSGKKRFHIVDLETEQILESGLVAHGKGKEKFTLRKKYSNINGSSCSSLGVYKIGESYTGSFGKSYRLLGLEKSNSNALSRAIVLHAMGCIPDEEIDYPICQSEGCPSVSVSFLERIGRTMAKTSKPVLLWVFDPLVDNL